MAYHFPCATNPPKKNDDDSDDIFCPFVNRNGLDRGDFQEAAYEVFFTASRSSSGFYTKGGSYQNAPDDIRGEGFGSGHGLAVTNPPGVGMATTSRVKKALGLKMVKRSRRSSFSGANQMSTPPSGSGSPRLGATLPLAGRLRRPMTASEIMRQQMQVTEQSDNRLRKTLMRTLVGQMGRRAETIILPLELLRHLKPSEFSDSDEYHQWQKRQLRILEMGLLHHPSIPVEKSDKSAENLRRVIQASSEKPIDTGRNSEAMKTLCNSVISLAWRSPDGGTTDVCHWADGYPLNVEIYTTLLQAVFDLKDGTVVLDEVDELLELLRKTWSMLGLNRPIHNLCFAWVLFQRYVVTGEIEPDLLAASVTVLADVASDAKKAKRDDPTYARMLALVPSAIKLWCEKRLLNYHGNYDRGTVGLMERHIPLVLSATMIIQDSVPPRDMVDHCIRSSSRNAFAKIMEEHEIDVTASIKPQNSICEMLVQVAGEIEVLALKERAIFAPILKKWQPNAARIFAVALHASYGELLKKHLPELSPFMNETILVLRSAGKLEKALVQMAVEDCENEYRGRGIVKEMVSYEADGSILKLLRQWIQERLQIGKESLQRSKETETWGPASKTEPYAQSAVELIRFVKEAVESFLQFPENVPESLVCVLTDGLEDLLEDFITFTASCGSKQSYLPTLPPLTRCSHESKLLKLWRKAASSLGLEYEKHIKAFNAGGNHSLSASRGTHRLYIRLNTLYYLLPQLQSLDKTLVISPKVTPSKSRFGSRRHLGRSYFQRSRSAIQSDCQHVAEVAAYRLIFLDTNSVFYGSLYAGGVETMRIKPALQTLKHNIALLRGTITEKAKPMALKELMKACFEAFLMVLLAGGSSRVFSITDHPIIEEDFDCLKCVFSTCEGSLIGENEIAEEAQTVDGVVALMGQPTQQLVEDFSILACEASGIGVVGSGQTLPMPPTTGRWHRSDPNTILRVLCYRNDRTANHFLKRTFQLAKRSATR